ncbi:MAG: hypothetical protein AAFN78_12235 [Pseudomonadota bacterium]
MKRLALLAFAAVGALSAQSAVAAGLVWLTASQSEVQVGDVVEIQYWWDFRPTGVFGGGVDIFFDPTVLEFATVEFDTSGALEPGFSTVLYPTEPPAGDSAVTVAAGNFAGVWGPLQVATLSFLATSAGLVDITVATTAVDVVGGFCDLPNCDRIEPDYSGTTVHVRPVPIPPMLWPFALALAALARCRSLPAP